MRNRLGIKMMTVVAVTLFGVAGMALAVNYYDGSGPINVNANWSDGAMSVPPALGVITNTDSEVSSATGDNWNNKGVRQTGGTLFDTDDNGLYLNQGTVYEIEDPRTDYSSYTNLNVSGVFKIWHNTTAPTVRLLSGHAEFGSLHFITAPTVEVSNGVFHAQALSGVNPKANFNLMSGGTGSVVIDDLAGYTLGSVYINFESGSEADFSVLEDEGAVTIYAINYLVGNGNISIDGVADTDPASYLITQDGTATTIALNPYRDYVIFNGQNDNPQAPIGALTLASNWEGGAIPSGSSTGLLMNTDNVWVNPTVYDFAVRQLAGQVNATGGLALRGGTDGSGITTTYIIDDSRSSYSSYTNLAVTGALTFWSHYGENMELSLLSGHVAADSLSLNAPGTGTLNLRDGILHAESMTVGKADVNLLSGGTGSIVVDSLDITAVNLAGQMYLNFESGNEGSFTIGSLSTNSSAEEVWELMLTASRLSVDGVVSTSPSDFIIANDGLSSTISLSPYRDYPKFIGQNNDPDAPVGSLTLAANWEGGVMPVGSTTGLVSETVNVWSGTFMQDLAVKQVGGLVYSASGFAMRGGSTNTSATSLYEIEDADTDYASYTNLSIAGTLTFWSQYGNPIELSLLSGHVEVGTLNAVSGLAVSNAASKAVINLKDGLMHVGTLYGGETSADRGWFEVNLNMMDGGAGDLVFDTLDCSEIDGYLTPNFAVNFETGSEAGITFGSKLTAGGTVSAAGIWAEMIAAGQLSIDGVVETRSYMFNIVQDGLASTLTLGDGSIPATPDEIYNSWINGYSVGDTSMTADPDGDGLSNLAEYALKGNPGDAGVHGQVAEVAMVAADGTNWFEYVHYERTDKADLGLTYTPEAGTDLVNTNWSGSALQLVGSGAGPVGFNAVTNRVPMQDEPQQFMRVKITLQD